MHFKIAVIFFSFIETKFSAWKQAAFNHVSHHVMTGSGGKEEILMAWSVVKEFSNTVTNRYKMKNM